MKKITSKELVNNFSGSKFIPQTEKDNIYLELITFIYNKGYISVEQAQVALAKYEVTKEAIGKILISNAYISQADYIKMILEFNPDLLMNEESISDSIDYNILLDTKTMIQTETKTKIYVSTLEKESIARNLLTPHINNKELIFNNAKISHIDNYLEKLKKFHLSENSFLDGIIREALKLGTSDIHIEPPFNNSFSIFYRIDGVRSHEKELSLKDYPKIVSLVKNRANMDTAERRIPQDGSFQMEYKGRVVDFRVSTVPANKNEKVVIRALDPDNVKHSLSLLGINPVDNWRKGISIPSGIAIIGGPTGSGKTTTLNASMYEKNRFEDSIYSIEDPVEYEIPNVSQININKEVGLGFAEALKALMRSDPDVVVVGEIRDEETARYAIKAAQTGHLVIATLHISSIRGVIPRLKDINIMPSEIQELLTTVLVQRLLRKICKECDGKGCKTCKHLGYKGRTIVSECAYFKDEKDVSNLALPINEFEIKWDTMVQDAVKKMKEGIVDIKEVIRVFGESGREELKKQGFEVDI